MLREERGAAEETPVNTGSSAEGCRKALNLDTLLSPGTPPAGKLQAKYITDKHQDKLSLKNRFLFTKKKKKKFAKQKLADIVHQSIQQSSGFHFFLSFFPQTIKRIHINKTGNF